MKTEKANPTRAIDRLMAHFDGHDLETLATVEKLFPVTVQPDLETAIEALLPGATFAGISARRWLRDAYVFILAKRTTGAPGDLCPRISGH